MEANERQYRKTEEFERVLSDAKHEPWATFDKWPLDVVRKECLKALTESYVVENDQRADWFESHIKQFREAGDSVWRDLLGIYVFSAREGLEKQAVEFAIGIAEDKDIYIPRISKMVAGAIKDHASLYWKISLEKMRKFIGMLLNEIASSLQCRALKGAYLPEDWYCAERAMRMIVAAGDFSFIGRLENLLQLYKIRAIKPNEESFDDFERFHHQWFLRQALIFLKRIEREKNRKTARQTT